MKTEELINKLKEIIDVEENSSNQDELDNNQVKRNKNHIAKLLLVITTFIIDVLRSPFKLIAKYIKNELIDAIKKDAILYALMGLLMGILFIFFSVLWLTISIIIGVYYFDQGFSIFNSILYSVGFQIMFFILISLIAFFAMKNMESMKMVKKLINTNK